VSVIALMSFGNDFHETTITCHWLTFLAFYVFTVIWLPALLHIIWKSAESPDQKTCEKAAEMSNSKQIHM